MSQWKNEGWSEKITQSKQDLKTDQYSLQSKFNYVKTCYLATNCILTDSARFRLSGWCRILYGFYLIKQALSFILDIYFQPQTLNEALDDYAHRQEIILAIYLRYGFLARTNRNIVIPYLLNRINRLLIDCDSDMKSHCYISPYTQACLRLHKLKHDGIKLDIKSEEYLQIKALTTLLIERDEKKVASLVYDYLAKTVKDRALINFFKTSARELKAGL